jgi:hypothetical protein
MEHPTTSPTPWNRILLEKPIVCHTLQEFLAFYGTPRFITMFKKPSSWPYPETDKSSPLDAIPFPYSIIQLG